LIKRVYEIDPLICPACGAEMRIIAFIVDPGVTLHCVPPVRCTEGGSRLG